MKRSQIKMCDNVLATLAEAGEDGIEVSLTPLLVSMHGFLNVTITKRKAVPEVVISEEAKRKQYEYDKKIATTLSILRARGFAVRRGGNNIITDLGINFISIGGFDKEQKKERRDNRLIGLNFVNIFLTLVIISAGLYYQYCNNINQAKELMLQRQPKKEVINITPSTQDALMRENQPTKKPG
jgi:hypothetical protein